MSVNLRLSVVSGNEPTTPLTSRFGANGTKKTVIGYLLRGVKSAWQLNPYRIYQRHKNPPFKYFAKHAYERFVITQGENNERY